MRQWSFRSCLINLSLVDLDAISNAPIRSTDLRAANSVCFIFVVQISRPERSRDVLSNLQDD